MTNLHIQENVDLTSFNSFGLACSARYFFTLTERAQLPLLQQWLQTHPLPVLVLGEGSNLLLTEDIQGLVIINRLRGIDVNHVLDEVTELKVASGENWHEFVIWCLDQGYHGLENLALIPGNIGAAPVQNIGAYGVEIADYIQHVEYFDLSTGEFVSLSTPECHFAYRDSVFKHELKGRALITSVGLVLPKKWQATMSYGPLAVLGAQATAQQIFDEVVTTRKAKLPDPKVLGNAGSFFKNPIISKAQLEGLLLKHPELVYYPLSDGNAKLAAGWLIDQLGLKGFSINDAAVHKHQALVLVNKSQASSDDLLALCRHIRAQVCEHFGVLLQPEVRFIGATGDIDPEVILGAPSNAALR